MGTTLLTEIVYMLARIMIADPQIFLQLMSATASSQNKAETVLYEGLLDRWWDTASQQYSIPHQYPLMSTCQLSLIACQNLAIASFLPWALHLWYRPAAQKFSDVFRVKYSISGSTSLGRSRKFEIVSQMTKEGVFVPFIESPPFTQALTEPVSAHPVV